MIDTEFLKRADEPSIIEYLKQDDEIQQALDIIRRMPPEKAELMLTYAFCSCSYLSESLHNNWLNWREKERKRKRGKKQILLDEMAKKEAEVDEARAVVKDRLREVELCKRQIEMMEEQ
jgi:hypothetical protein